MEDLVDAVMLDSAADIWHSSIQMGMTHFDSIRAAVEAVAPLIAAKALRDMADRTLAEAVCCDEYEEFQRTGKRPRHPHEICYWGGSHVELLCSVADEIEKGS